MVSCCIANATMTFSAIILANQFIAFRLLGNFVHSKQTYEQTFLSRARHTDNPKPSALGQPSSVHPGSKQVSYRNVRTEGN